MAAPTTHVLTGLAVLIAGASPGRPLRWRHAVAASALALGPDLLLLLALALGAARFTAEGASHSVLLVVLLATVLWLRLAAGAGDSRRGLHGAVWLPVETTVGAVGLAVAVWLSHAVLDALAADLAIPPGVAVLWPIWEGPLQIAAWFPVKVVETDDLEAFMNSVLSAPFLRQAAREALGVAPLLVAAWLLRIQRRSDPSP